MRVARAVLLIPFLLLAVGCGARAALRSAPGEGSSAPAPVTDTQVAGGETADQPPLQEQLAARDREIEQLRNEVQQAHARENDLRIALRDASPRADGEAPGSLRTQPDGGGAGATGDGGAARPDIVVTALRAALSQEQERRRVVETQLNRLKEETSAAHAGTRVPEADLLAVKQELVSLQRALADERAAHEHSAARLHAPPGSGDPNAPPAPEAAETARLRVRVQQLQEEKDAIVDSLSRNLAATQQRVATLEQDLAVARSAAPPHNGDTENAAATVRAENRNLQAQLDAERRRTEELTAKLNVAKRITDLIFRMQTEPAEGQPPPR